MSAEKKKAETKRSLANAGKSRSVDDLDLDKTVDLLRRSIVRIYIHGQGVMIMIKNPDRWTLTLRLAVPEIPVLDVLAVTVSKTCP